MLLAGVAIIGGTAGLGDWRAKQRAQKELAQEQAEALRLDRQRLLLGWSPNGVNVYGVSLVTTPAEFAQAQRELSADEPSEYVFLRVVENDLSNVNRAHSLRQTIAHEGYLAKAPSTAEYEALEAGRHHLNGASTS